MKWPNEIGEIANGDSAMCWSGDLGGCVKTKTIGILHRRGGSLPRAPAVKLQFVINDSGDDEIAMKKWNFNKATERNKFLTELERRGPQVLWIQQQSCRLKDSVSMSAEACRIQAKRGQHFVMEVPVGCDATERSQLKKLTRDAAGRKYQANNMEVISNWDQLGVEYHMKAMKWDKVAEMMTKLMETSRMQNLEEELSRLEEAGLHEDSTLTNPVVPFNMEEQWDELTGKTLDLKKVTEGRLKELKTFTERKVYVHYPRKAAMEDMDGKFVKTRWVQTVKGEEVRCRLVAQEFARGDPRVDLFAGTPPPLCRTIASESNGKPTTQEMDIDGVGHFLCLPAC